MISPDGECVRRQVPHVANRRVDIAPVEGGSPLNATGIVAVTDKPAPPRASSARVECPVPRRSSVQCRRSCASDVRCGRGNTFTPEPAKSHTLKLFSHGGHRPAVFGPHPSSRARGPAPETTSAALPVRHVEGDDRVEVPPGGIARLAPAFRRGRETGCDRCRLRVELTRRAENQAVQEIDRWRVHKRCHRRSRQARRRCRAVRRSARLFVRCGCRARSCFRGK